MISAIRNCVIAIVAKVVPGMLFIKLDDVVLAGVQNEVENLGQPQLELVDLGPIL